MRTAVAVAILAIACTTPKPATCPAVAAATAEEAPLPPPDDQLRRWQAIHADGDRPPEGTTAAALVPELVAYLGSPDPVRRDGIGYEVLARWVVLEPRLDAAEVRALGAQLLDGLAAPLGAPDSVYRRSFSALVLSLVVARDVADPVLDDDVRHGLLAAARAYAEREDDLRGHTGARGWAHAAAHAADLLKFLAREPSFDDVDRAVILDAVAALVVRRHGYNFHHGEDGRLALPVIEAVRRGVASDRIDAWVDAMAAPLLEAGGEDFDAALFAAQRNARNLLFTLFVQLSFEVEPSPSATYLLQRVRDLLGS